MVGLFRDPPHHPRRTPQAAGADHLLDLLRVAESGDPLVASGGASGEGVEHGGGEENTIGGDPMTGCHSFAVIQLPHTMRKSGLPNKWVNYRQQVIFGLRMSLRMVGCGWNRVEWWNMVVTAGLKLI